MPFICKCSKAILIRVKYTWRVYALKLLQQPHVCEQKQKHAQNVLHSWKLKSYSVQRVSLSDQFLASSDFCSNRVESCPFLVISRFTDKMVQTKSRHHKTENTHHVSDLMMNTHVKKEGSFIEGHFSVFDPQRTFGNDQCRYWQTNQSTRLQTRCKLCSLLPLRFFGDTKAV